MSQVNLPKVGVVPCATALIRVAGKPHIYKRGGFHRIALPAAASLPAREYWYINFAEVKVFFAHWSQIK